MADELAVVAISLYCKAIGTIGGGYAANCAEQKAGSSPEAEESLATESDIGISAAIFDRTDDCPHDFLLFACFLQRKKIGWG